MKEASKQKLALEAADEIKHGHRSFGHDDSAGRSQEELTKIALELLEDVEVEEEVGERWASEGFDAAVWALSNMIYWHLHPAE